MSLQSYSLLFEETVEELSATARLWKHNASDAEVLSFVLDDENKVFGVTFRTPPKDSTGVAHILEHSVLCGSEKYPVKEPFVELLKGSLQTFLNAFTYPDKTCYPVASTNLQDFYNLIDVYLDAVFFPRITPYTLKQEGWHLEAETAEGPFAYKGVVYNEMKGVYSSPDSLLAEQTQQSLFPDITYGLDSGGNPADIPNLTFEQFSAFHQSFYHPANSRVFFWGNDPEEKRLELLDKVFTTILEKQPVTEEQKKQIAADSHVALQKPFTAPREIEKKFATNDEDDKAMFTLNWLLPETSSADSNFALGILEHILLGLPGSPLRKALIESGLGEDITGNGLDNDLRQMFFSVGLSGITAETIPQAATLIEKTLAKLAETGIDQEAIDAAINSIEFSLRENNTGNFPVGLSVMVRSLTTWLYESDPLAILRFEKPIASIKNRLASGEKVFESLIKTHFLSNPHKTLVRLLPDTTLAEQIEKAEEARVNKAIAPLSTQARQELINEAQKLQAMQEEHDSPEALASIPRLSLPDLPRVNKLIPTDKKTVKNIPLFFHNLPTNGLVYFDACFDLAAVNAELVPLLPLLGRCFFETGTQQYSYTQFGQLMAARTGGIDASTLLTSRLNDDNTITPIAKVCVSGKATEENAHELTQLMLEGLLHCQLEDKDRFLQMVLEEKARMEQYIVPRGNAIIASRIKATHSVEGWLNEITGGVSYLEYLKTLVKDIEKNWAQVLNNLQLLQKQSIASGNVLLNLTTTEKSYKTCLPLLETFIQQLPQTTVDENTETLWKTAQAQIDIFTKEAHTHEALLTPSTVNYVGQGADIYALGHTFHGSMLVVLRYLRMTWLWDAVRVRGGAYGAGCSLNRLNGSLLFTSYRDPNITGTIDNYKKAAQWLRNNKPDDNALTTAIVGAIGDLDSHMLPPAKGFTALIWHLTNDTKERRQILRNEILSTTAEDFEKCAAVIENALENSQTVILGGSALERVAESLNLKQIKVL